MPSENRGHGSPGPGVTGSYELPCGFWEPNPDPLQEWQMLFTTEPSLQLLSHAPFLCCSSNDHLAIFSLLGFRATEDSESLHATLTPKSICMLSKIRNQPKFLKVNENQSTGKQNPTIKELSMKLGLKINIYMITFCIYHIIYSSIEKKRQPHCVMNSCGQKLSGSVLLEHQKNGYSCGNYKRLWNKHSWVRQALKENIIPASWVKNEINTRKHKYI